MVSHVCNNIYVCLIVHAWLDVKQSIIGPGETEYSVHVGWYYYIASMHAALLSATLPPQCMVGYVGGNDYIALQYTVHAGPWFTALAITVVRSNINYFQ